MGTALSTDPAQYHPEQTELPLNFLAAFAVATFLGYLVCVALARGQRLAATSLAFAGVWFAYWCYFVAAMSISGIWL
jgi:hypothetical protein